MTALPNITSYPEILAGDDIKADKARTLVSANDP
jgi:hypothetical protein